MSIKHDYKARAYQRSEFLQPTITVTPMRVLVVLFTLLLATAKLMELLGL